MHMQYSNNNKIIIINGVARSCGVTIRLPLALLGFRPIRADGILK